MIKNRLIDFRVYDSLKKDAEKLAASHDPPMSLSVYMTHLIEWAIKRQKKFKK